MKVERGANWSKNCSTEYYRDKTLEIITVIGREARMRIMGLDFGSRYHGRGDQ